MRRKGSYPIPDRRVLDDAGYDAVLAGICDELDAGRTVYVHCWGGKGRTTTVARIAELRAGTRKPPLPCPETPAQHDVIRRRAAYATSGNPDAPRTPQ